MWTIDRPVEASLSVVHTLSRVLANVYPRRFRGEQFSTKGFYQVLPAVSLSVNDEPGELRGAADDRLTMRGGLLYLSRTHTERPLSGIQLGFPLCVGMLVVDQVELDPVSAHTSHYSIPALSDRARQWATIMRQLALALALRKAERFELLAGFVIGAPDLVDVDGFTRGPPRGEEQ